MGRSCGDGEIGKIPKILSPINSFEGAVRVIQAGADEIYCGVTIPKINDFVLYRGSNCEISTYKELGNIVKYAHNHNVKVVVTVNRPFMAKIIEKAVRKHICSYLDKNVDGLIVGDMGVLSIINDLNTDVDLYASTYMASMNYEAVEFLRKLGFNRIILDRQLSLVEISKIVRQSKVAIEIFIHGGGCSNTNGNCYLYHFKFPAMIQAVLMSEGALRNPCTLPYDIYDLNDVKNKIGTIPIMDALEVCSLCRLPELMNLGVTGFKIVGRGDSISVQESTTKMYRELIDLIACKQISSFKERVESLKRHSRNSIFNANFPNFWAIFCEQKRCYYNPLIHAPYKLPVSWQAWTKTRLMFKRFE